MTILDTLPGSTPFTYTADELTNEEYHRMLEWLSRSFCHQVFRYGGSGQMLMDRGVSLFSGSTATTLGSDFDELWTARCEGKAFDDVFAVAGPEHLSAAGQRRGKAFDEFKEMVAAEGRREVSADTRDKLLLMWNAVEQNSSAMRLLNSTVQCQRSVFWIDRNGHKRRDRWDGETAETVYDVKTTSSSWSDLAKSFDRFGYFWQAKWYMDSAVNLGFARHRMPFVCVQTVPPYECQVFLPPQELVDAAGPQIDTTLTQIALRRESGEYLPADYGDVKELEVPRWMWPTKEEEA